MADARTKAEQLAKLGGVSLGKPRSIAETQGATPVYPAGIPGVARDSAGSTPVETGTNTVTVDVTVRWAIE